MILYMSVKVKYEFDIMGYRLARRCPKICVAKFEGNFFVYFRLLPKSLKSAENGTSTLKLAISADFNS